MIKKILFVSMLFLLSNCGYETIYSKKNSSNIFEYKGNNKLSSIAFIKKLN